MVSEIPFRIIGEGKMKGSVGGAGLAWAWSLLGLDFTMLAGTWFYYASYFCVWLQVSVLKDKF